MTRRVLATGLAVSTLLIVPAPALAHGIGGRQDLPVPLSYFIGGAGLALVISFVALSSRWREPRLQDGPHSRPLRWPGAAQFYRTLSWVGGVGFVLVVLGGIIDGTTSRNNIAPVLVWVYFWLVVPFLGVLLGDLWRWMSPFRAITRWVNADRPERPELLERVGMWPATLVFVAFTWLELVSPDSSLPRTLAIAAIAYMLYKVAITAWAGPETGLLIGGAFANYNALLGAIAPVEATRAPWSASVGADVVAPRDVTVAGVHRRGWLRALPVLPLRRGFAAFVVAMIGTVTYDGMSATGWWTDLWGRTEQEIWFGTLALVGTVVVIGAGYYVASWAAARIAGSSRSPSSVAASFAHTLVPIAFAYAFAHYFTLILFEGQQLVHMASDPFGLGWDLFGTADWVVVFASSTTWIWYIQVLAIVGGHIGGVILAHDRALGEFGTQDAIRTQYAMLVLMVALTSLGLLILAG